MKKRIVILGPAHPLRGGIAAFNERLAYGLQERGHEVVIFNFSLQYPSFLFPGKSQYTDGPAPDGLVIHSKLNSINPLSWWKVGRELKKMAPDLIIAKFWLPFLGPSLGSVLRLAKSNGHTRSMSILDNIVPHEKRIGDFPLARYFAQAIDTFIVMSRAVERDLQNFITDQKVVYSPHPIYDHYGDAVPKLEARAHLQLEASAKYVLFFGFIRDYKGLDLLLRAIADPRLAKADIRLMVAGEYYGNEEKYTTLIDNLNLQDRVILRNDYIPDDEVRYFFGAADLVTQPYKTATQSGISQIAYHFEKPMVVTNVGGLPEIVPHGEAGYVVNRDPKEIADAILDFYENKQEAKLQAGVKAQKPLFSWDTMIDWVEKLAFPEETS